MELVAVARYPPIYQMRLGRVGPGYRVYYGRTGNALYLLLCGGDKGTQDADIKIARALWKVLNSPAKKSAK
jgi:putative addiction module killer protein